MNQNLAVLLPKSEMKKALDFSRALVGFKL
jgi:hypothetical protein